MTPIRLTLRTKKTNFTGFPDITLNSTLSHEELDNNFISLKSEILSEGNINEKNEIILTKIGGDNIIIPLTGLTADENNYSRTINVNEEDLTLCDICSGTTLEEKIVQYVNTLNYEKLSQDADIWIEYNGTDIGEGIFTTEFNKIFS